MWYPQLPTAPITEAIDKLPTGTIVSSVAIILLVLLLIICFYLFIRFRRLNRKLTNDEVRQFLYGEEIFQNTSLVQDGNSFGDEQ